jgi:hypothetical protein
MFTFTFFRPLSKSETQFCSYIVALPAYQKSCLTAAVKKLQAFIFNRSTLCINYVILCNNMCFCVAYYFNRVPTVREKFFIFQGQGIVRKIFNWSGKFLFLEKSGNFVTAKNAGLCIFVFKFFSGKTTNPLLNLSVSSPLN